MAVINADDLAKQPKYGFDKASEGYYQKAHVFLITPMVDPWIHRTVYRSWNSLQYPQNCRRQHVDVVGMEVGAAYDKLVHECLEHPLNVPWLLTLEHDNVIPADAYMRLLKAISKCPDCGARVEVDSLYCPEGHKAFDAVGGLYFTKDPDFPTPMAFGYPGDPDSEPMGPVDVSAALETGEVIEVRGVAMGCTLFRAATLRTLERPYFKSTSTETQDLQFCRRARKEIGARFAVDCGVQVGHLDFESGMLY